MGSLTELYLIAGAQNKIGLNSGHAENLFPLFAMGRLYFKFIAEEAQRPAGYVNTAA